MNHQGDDIEECGTLSDGMGGWPELATLCSNTTGCVAVNMYYTDNDGYMYCLKSNATNLTASPNTMPQACLGTLVKVAPSSPSPPPATSCTTAAVAPAGWTFESQQASSDPDSNIICRYPAATAPTNWPTEQIDACASMPGCNAVSYTVSEDLDGNRLPSFCYKWSADILEAGNNTTPQPCMGTMVNTGEWMETE